MDEESFCLECGYLESECNCFEDIDPDSSVDGIKTFRWEYQQEGCSMHGSKFKKIYHDSDY